ncbi:hypothetical protein VTJ83DRAFT_3860 [Remersonia thermophila]|uniref:PEBP family protein n=1 Tax=Remersonia thermophila TaxID=72144 RepID=A0ABR4DG46_9PEZI
MPPFTRTVAAALLLAGLAAAQTPPGFVPEVNEKLEIVFGDKVVQTPGESLARAETARQPTLGTRDAPLAGESYLWVMIDLDVPGNFQNPSSAPRRTNLHALITGLVPSAAAHPDANGIYPLVPASPSPGPVAYVGPGPPPETPPHPHKYVSLLYETAPGFAVTREQVGPTFGFDLAAFVERVGIAEAPVRAGYFNVTG